MTNGYRPYTPYQSGYMDGRLDALKQALDWLKAHRARGDDFGDLEVSLNAEINARPEFERPRSAQTEQQP